MYPVTEWVGHVPSRYPFHLIPGQRAENLRSQLGRGLISRAARSMGVRQSGWTLRTRTRKGSTNEMLCGRTTTEAHVWQQPS